MKLNFLGTGTSYGVPYIACDCDVCRSNDLCNKRLRSSILVEEGDTRVLVDSTPDLREQFLRAGITTLSGVLWTHSHNDHIIGLDDLRPITDKCGYIDGYANEETMTRLKVVFDYVFVEGRNHGGFPRVRGHVLEPRQTVKVENLRVTAIPIMHYKREIFAYRIESDTRTLVYATDCSYIPDTSWDLMRDADLLVLGALRYKEHPAHFSVAQALHAVEKLKPRRALFTHIAHDLEHRTINAELPPGVEVAYDTQTIEV
ncbi:MAG TPA: MBL fold metallo-hydrolase [Abditibacteriaceae bacterium]|jgi:phosphoribosyl 1,2-cyclic phosphate phosphodiesterase